MLCVDEEALEALPLCCSGISTTFGQVLQLPERPLSRLADDAGLADRTRCRKRDGGILMLCVSAADATKLLLRRHAKFPRFSRARKFNRAKITTFAVMEIFRSSPEAHFARIPLLHRGRRTKVPISTLQSQILLGLREVKVATGTSTRRQSSSSGSLLRWVSTSGGASACTRTSWSTPEGLLTHCRGKLTWENNIGAPNVFSGENIFRVSLEISSESHLKCQSLAIIVR